MSIYKPCDVRGRVADELSPELYRDWGRVLGGQIEPPGPLVVGGDVRESTPEFLAALVDGLAAAGVTVLNLGLCPTPMIYFAKEHFAAGACAIVTASHNPASINGLKWMMGDRPPAEEDVQRLACETESLDDAPGSPLKEVHPGIPSRVPGVELRGTSNEPPERNKLGARCARPQAPGGSSAGNVRQVDVSTEYRAMLVETHARTRRPVELHVVLDPMHGCWATRAKPLLEAVFPRARFTAIHDTPRGDFGGHGPDCSRAARLAELCQAVTEQDADLGIAFDGDGDRVAFVDGGGVALSPEEATHALLHGFGTELSEQPFVFDLKFSHCIAETAAMLGAEVVAERSGHAFIRRCMLRTDALFGAEISGHYFYRALAGGDDGLYTACRLLAQMARTGKSLAELRGNCPAVYLTPDLRVSIAAGARQSIIEQVRAAWSDYPQSTIDGVRVAFDDGWALIRASVTEPALTFRFESIDQPSLDSLVRRFCDKLPEVGEELWGKYEAVRAK